MKTSTTSTPARLFWTARAIVAACVLGAALPAAAHPAPFSYVDLRIHAGAVDVMVAAHIFDLAHDLGIDPPQRLLAPQFLAQESAALSPILQNRLTIQSDGDLLEAGPWSAPEIVNGQQLIRIRTPYVLH